jgi:Cdc6-like AAA superfamily ATPase
MSDGCGKVLSVRCALARQCLQQLSNEEIEELLSSSYALREGVRELANKPKGTRVDARQFRMWMSMPAASDTLLQKLPAVYAREYQERLDAGERIRRTVGVRALLALHESDVLTAEEFRILLDEFRNNPEPEAESGCTEPAEEQPPTGEHVDPDKAAVFELSVATNVDSTAVEELIETLRARAQSTADALLQAAHKVTAGVQLSSDVPELITSWSTLLKESWAALGAAEVPPAPAFEVFEALRDRLVKQECAEQLKEAQQAERQEKLDKLQSLRQVVTGLRDLAPTGETYRDAYEDAQAEITELELELGLAVDGAEDADEAAGDIPSRGVAEDDAGDPHAAVQAPSFCVPQAAAEITTGGPPPPAVDSSSGDGDQEPRRVSADIQEGPVVEDTQSEGASTEPDQSDNEARIEVITAESITAAPDAVDASEPEVSERGASDAAMSLTDYTGDLAELVQTGRFGAAWLAARAAGLPALDAAAYRLAASAFHSGPGGLDPAEVLIGLTTMLDADEFASAQSAKIALAATLRAALAAGWTPRSELEVIARQANLDDHWRALVDASIAAADRNYQHLQDFGRRFEPSIDEVLENARALNAQLHQLRIKFTRADKVLRYLMRHQEPLGAALEAVLAPTSGQERRDALTGALTALESPDAVIEAADHKVNSPQQQRGPILAHARNSLRRAIEQVADCLTQALNAAVALAADTQVAVVQESRHRLLAAAKAIPASEGLGDPGSEAMVRLLDWITTPQAPARVASEMQMIIDESLSLTTVDRDADGLPIMEGADPGMVVEELGASRTPRELYDAYTARGDLQQAAAVTRQLPELQDRIAEDRARWARRLRNEVAAVRAEVARTYADDFTQEARVDAEARLVEPAEYSGDRFDLQLTTLKRLQADLTRHRGRTADELRARVAHQVTNPGDRDSITDLIDKEDFVGANELLALARSGPLPSSEDSDDTAGARIYDAFIADLSALNVAAGTPIRDVAAAFMEMTGEAASMGQGDLDRLNNWDNLMSPRTHGRLRQAVMTSILRTIGLDMRGDASKQPSSVRHFDLYRVSATPVDRSLVPGLGSQATHYMIAATSDAVLLKQKLSSFPTTNGPNIVLFDGVLTIDQRRQYLAACREQKISAIVVDHAVAAWVAVHHPRSFRTIQQITLPFTCFSHYTVVAGNVPDEVFVGRADEQNQLTSQTGSLFVYGGRQLGKSALLRKIQRDFNTVADQHAIFIDLNAHGIGTWSESRKLWQVLYNELANIAGFGLKPNPTVRNHEPVIRAIQTWLSGDESRRLLLLLDEADAFLEKESSGAPHAFMNIGPLKGLFDSTGGRFKPVFAGLHKVQRLQNVANTPLAHGGRDVLIGPLAAKPARDLVVKPLEALGYQFENPDAVWRLLAFTNLQPGLIQVVCNDLIAHLQSRPLRKSEPLIAITDDDIDAVTQNPVTVDKIAEKLRLTIELEDRYRVIALAVAIMCMDDSFRERYTADDIREHCEMYWQEGFEDLNSAEFTVYLDELIGLGVLSKDRDNRYSVRSPNIVTMLGTREQLATVLEEQQFQLEPAYNPKSTRRQVTISDVTVRSPLSEHDLSQLIPVTAKYEARNFVIVGSEALGISHVAPILKSVGAERHVEVVALDGTGDITVPKLTEFKFAGGGTRGPRLFVIDASGVQSQQAAHIAETVEALPRRGQGHLVVLFGASGIDAANSFATVSNAVDTQVISLKKWSGDGIRSWHDNPFTTPEARSQLLTHSGGWPQLVEQAVADVANRGISNAEECQLLSTFPPNSDSAAEFLRNTGLDDRFRGVLSEWAAFGSTDHEAIADIADVLGRDVDDMRTIATNLALLGIINTRNDEYMIDPVVMRALHALA